jgi:sentrin-specific protease 8
MHIQGPEVTQAIKMMGNPQEVNAIFLDHLDTSSRTHIIFAINDNSSDEAGGSHWSLCVFSKSENTFFHFDSFKFSNHFPCESLVKILKSCFDRKDAEIIETDCLQQNNCYDCGIFVLCHTDVVCQAIEKQESLSSLKKLQPKKVHVKRGELIEIIKNLNA